MHVAGGRGLMALTPGHALFPGTLPTHRHACSHGGPWPCRVSGSILWKWNTVWPLQLRLWLYWALTQAPADCVGTALICKRLAFWTHTVNPRVKLSTVYVTKAAKGQKRSQTGWTFSQKEKGECGEGRRRPGESQATALSPLSYTPTLQIFESLFGGGW